MIQITFPLTAGQQGANVANLQDALARLIGAARTRPGIAGADIDWRALESRLAEGRRAGMHGDVTRMLVARFQELNGLPATGEVDGPTADRLNAALAESSLSGDGGDDDGDEDDAAGDDERLDVWGPIRPWDGPPASGRRGCSLSQ